MNEPKLVLFDEPTSALDTQLGEHVMELIRDRSQGQGHRSHHRHARHPHDPLLRPRRQHHRRPTRRLNGTRPTESAGHPPRNSLSSAEMLPERTLSLDRFVDSLEELDEAIAHVRDALDGLEAANAYTRDVIHAGMRIRDLFPRSDGPRARDAYDRSGYRAANGAHALPRRVLRRLGRGGGHDDLGGGPARWPPTPVGEAPFDAVRADADR